MSFDWRILYWIKDTFSCGMLDYLMPKITLLGNGGIIWILAAIFLICRKKYRRYGIILIVGLVIGVVVGNVVLKNVFARPRPCWQDSSVKLLIPSPTDYSFPSGHTLSAVIGATIITMINRRFGWIVIPIAALIAFSRLYLFVHFPTDILGGIIIGMLIGVITFHMGKLTDKHLT